MRILRQSRADLIKAAETKDIVIFGGGAVTLRLLSAVDIADKVSVICENNDMRIGSKLCGIEIVSEDYLANLNPENVAIVVASIKQQKKIAEQIQNIGDFDMYFAWTILNETFEVVACDLFDNRDKIEEAAGLLVDDVSRKIYKEVIERRMLYGEEDFSDLKIDGDEEYLFPPMFTEKRPADEVVIDCGAYTGDTVEMFCKVFGRGIKKIWALECGHEQLVQLRERVTRINRLPYSPEIEVLPYAVSDSYNVLDFYQPTTTNGSFVVQNREFAKNDKYNSEIYQVNAAPLDSLLPVDEPVTMIKMDIEGSEYQALQGAAEIIKRCRPKLAVSIYHSGLDYFRLILLIKELVPEYKIAIRHHKKKHVDTDLYAWV